MYSWQPHISTLAVIQLLLWSKANSEQLLKQEWRKSHKMYRDGWQRAKLHVETQEAVIHYLRTGERHISPNFEVWLNYWCWWAILIEYCYTQQFLDDTGMNSTFHRFCTWLRIARDEMLGLDTEPLPVIPKRTPVTVFEDARAMLQGVG